MNSAQKQELIVQMFYPVKLIISLWSQASKRSTNVKRGNGELLELRLLETGFLSRFQNKMSRF